MGTVLVITGPPGAGKSTLAEKLRSELAIPLISKDVLKESLFDNLGYSDRARSIDIGRAAFELQYIVASELVRFGLDFILETAFHKSSSTKIRELLRKSDVVQLWVSADADVLVERVKTRTRHPGHGVWNDTIEQEIRDKVGSGIYDPLDIGGEVLHLNSSCFDSSEYQESIQDVMARFA
jgi:predicted kinase